MRAWSHSPRLPVILRLALRELREGVRGFRIFLACLILGVAAIAGVGSLASALIAGMTEEGQALLAGDAELRLLQREIDDTARAWLEARGTVSQSLRLRTNGFAPQSGERTLVEMRAVDGLYPFYGELRLRPAMRLADALARRDGRWGVVVDPALAERLSIGIGDTLRLGKADFEVRARIAHEPDRANLGFQLGPSAIVAWEAVPATGLVTFGSLTNYHYKIRLDDGVALSDWQADLKAAFPEAGWRIRTRDTAAPGIRAFVDRMGTFLLLVGLTALTVGGVGVGNAVRAYLDRRTDTIATLKILGAPGSTVFAVYLLAVMLLALLAVAIGLAAGAALPMVLAALWGDALPVPARFGIHAEPLAVATLYGLLITVVFTAWPLGQARDVPAARLFRKMVAPTRHRPRPAYVVLAAAASGLVVAAAIALSDQRALTAGFAVAAMLALALLRAAGWALERLAARVPRPRHPGLRMAIANLHRPGAATGPVVVSLGLGLTLFAALALVEGNMNREVAERLPDRAPAFFFVDIQPDQYADFVATAQAIPGVRNLVTVPSLRGRITHVKGVPADEVTPDPGSAWVLHGDRGLSYAREIPEGNALLAGEWWPPDYDGPPLVSFSAEEAHGLGLDVGDEITVSVLGRSITATVASLRDVEWGTFGFNFVILFDPHTLAAAPHGHMATLEAEGEAERRAYRTLTDRFPNVTAVRMREVLASVNSFLDQIGTAVRATAIVTILAGILVLAGAMSAGYHHRLYDAAIMKVLGAVRRDVLTSFAVECAVLGLLTGIVGLVLGGLAGWIVVKEVMELDFMLFPGTMALTVGLSVSATLAFGLLGTWTALAVRPAAVLRTA